MGKFIDGAVRPFITFGAFAVLAYMAVVQNNHDAVVAVIGLAPTVIMFWYRDRAADKAADVAATVALAAVSTTTPAIEVK